ncbi:MAG: Succinylglutamate desuccinylase/aspartoacylase (Modular protein), partial [Deltaproteobacteria bacterium]|nr:Succinylglutamate desuccinylase/aspartoacylase (Modular protein) [Deltaproteobacteria bacterium]
MKRRFSFLLLALAAVSFLAGCAHLFGRAEAPRVNIANIVPKEVKLFEQVFSLDLRVMNPTNREITIRGVVFDLEVNGQPFARGVSNLTTTIGPFASEILQVEAVTTLASLLRQIVQAQNLRGTNLDTPVYFLDSAQPGATALVLAGTHGREIAGFTAAMVLLESAEIIKGRVIVIPFANRSSVSIQDKLNRIPRFHPINGRSDPRNLPYGDRLTDQADQGEPDPKNYVHPSGGAFKNGAESRNLNRVYPGKADGTPTEQLAFAIMELIRREKVDFALDLHESKTPEAHLNETSGKSGRDGRLAYMLICHPCGVEIGANALFEMELDTGIFGKIEKSNPASRGRSHFEIGHATDAI